jgi:hypothetical protein
MADGGGNQSLDFALHEKQTAAYTTDATEVLFGGSAGPGKSHLMRIAAIMWCAQIPGLQVYLFRREFPDLYKNHMEGPSGFPAMLAPWIAMGWAKLNLGKNFIEFYNGSKIHLCHCQHEKNMYDYQGAEIHVLMIDELTHFSEPIYRYLRGRTRIGSLNVPDQYKGQFPRVLCGSNPGGVGHNWVKAAWVSLLKPFEKRRMGKDDGGLLRQFIPAFLSDNPTLTENDPDYADRLSGLGDAALVKAMLDGDWNIVSGGALDDVWSERAILPRFPIPSSWRVDRSFDWGSSKPFSVLWFAECDGTEATLPNGMKWAPPKRSLVLLHEWYGAKGPNQGLKMPARDIGNGIKAIEKDLVAGKWCAQPKAGPADNSIANVSQPGTPTIADEMRSVGVTWEESDKAPGTRKIGLDLIRARLTESKKPVPENPALFIMDHCRNAIAHWPVLPRDAKNPDDVDTSAEDHDYDALRYRVLKAARAVTIEPLRI